MKELILKLKFDKPNNIGFLRRFISYMMDWYIGGMLTSLPIILTYTAMNSSNIGTIEQNINIFEYPLNIIIGLASFMVAALYYVYVPMFINNGQTLGKKIMKLRIVSNDYSEASKKQIFIRQFVIILLLEGSLYTSSNMLHQVLNEVTGANIVSIYNTIGIAITALSALLVVIFKSRRALHDIITSTRVVAENSIELSLV
ncbi:RDD family protein [Clostridium sp. NSJ-6]|uniref:RDD family protein n=1 Tax=Clostridium hominis TaxID=2763036 RepID=A0ABR7DCT9_9CLOT|nr:RDD family protein [Clostridium hominis]MBC5629211.1 RDD family protein [Clostridium hominis]MDU2671731.1 RDD family protein [Clostridium sp.]